MSGDRLRLAAAKIREVVNVATPGPWWAAGDGVIHETDTESGHAVVATGGRSSGDAQLIALMASPPVARAVADWLDAESRWLQFSDSEALRVADAILWDQS
jgi:hypothetical protein